MGAIRVHACSTYWDENINYKLWDQSDKLEPGFACCQCPNLRPYTIIIYIFFFNSVFILNYTILIMGQYIRVFFPWINGRLKGADWNFDGWLKKAREETRCMWGCHEQYWTRTVYTDVTSCWRASIPMTMAIIDYWSKK